MEKTSTKINADKQKNDVSFGIDIVKCCKLLKYRNMQMTKPDVLEFEIKSLHNKKTSNYKCSVCSKEFERTSLLNLHMWIHKSTETFKVHSFRCTKCSKTYSIYSCFLQHLKIHHCGDLHFCKYCTLPFDTFAMVKHHVKNAHKKEMVAKGRETAKFSCAFCQACYYTIDHLVHHLQKHHPSEDLDKYYPQFNTDTETVKIHQKVTSKENENCEFKNDTKDNNGNKLPLRFTSVTNEKVSSKVVSKYKKAKMAKYYCHQCKVKFVSGIQLKIHEKKKHKIDKIYKPVYGCAKCPAKFFKLRVLQKHLSKHHGQNITPKI